MSQVWAFRTSRLVAALLSVGLLAPVQARAAAQANGASQPTAKPDPTVQRTPPASAEKPSRPSGSTVQARRARLARARAARARELRELAQPRYRLDENGVPVPDVRAEAAIIYNPETAEVIWEENAQDQRSIASITKVMTALTFLEDGPDLTQVVTVTNADRRGASTTYLRRNDRVLVGDLLHLLLIGSDNAAARVLARISPWGSKGFVGRMNEKAMELGLAATTFADPSGLDPANVSSAYDLSRLIAYATGNDQLAAIMQTAEYVLSTKRRRVTIRNTNKLIGGDVEVRGGKTGFIRKSGYCLVALLKLPAGPQVAVVVLGARSSLARFMETRHLVNWLAAQGQELFFREPL